MSYSLVEVNQMDKETFVADFGHVAEHSPWVAEKAYELGPFRVRDDLADAFTKAMDTAPQADQLALIRAHPDLAGKAALAGELAESSRDEQAGAGLDRLTREEFARFCALNDAYKNRFGFPFIFAVKGATKTQILAAFEPRLHNSPSEEFSEALRQIARIFRFRLEALVEAPH
ncbi:2-oxo-4-hydroxy-4-carboxy-5-ureidoimidazoline decarboxylase [Pseudovibrio sp. SPO723]|uniref:2-oxo-4-hydroxy-4-carboxy-5-ureidoimidazoline decarboxylase n=1 Tax=Nesiotobacter zosterae TaxID=392721 RepID=UPI0029C5A23F|nr:2-oxo-4-hydroxy-4-carboxy-5-ureidoimidazoline decarboxylase [Pseudovibrio sp. SPO723]MDX5593875.1 2-oxo-4-hydroxy-4-carboxy-5-ureidoimidazoline decarboxylase [Pseudovibrio sp. SPO723]